MAEQIEEYLLGLAFNLAHKLFPSGGTCLEFGVGWGSTYTWQMRQILEKYHNSKLIGFDSFEGLPKETEGVWFPARHAEGCLAFSKDVVLDGFDKLNVSLDDPRFKLVDGWFCDTLTDELRKTIENVIFVNIDIDIHRSAIGVLDFITPLLQKDAIIYWDDWKDPQDKYEGKWGEHLAYEEWSEKNPKIEMETLVYNHYNQRYMKVIKGTI